MAFLVTNVRRTCREIALSPTVHIQNSVGDQVWCLVIKNLNTVQMSVGCSVKSDANTRKSTDSTCEWTDPRRVVLGDV